MRQFFVSLFLILLTFSMLLTDAEARRFGGGKSFGVSRPSYSSSNTNHASRMQPATKPGASRWLAPLAGLALGGLFASLLMGHGLGAGMLSWLMVAGVIFIVWQLFARLKNNQKPVTQEAYQRQAQPEYSAPLSPQPTHYNVVNADFNRVDVNRFLRQAKTIFIRLQAAYDTKNLEDIREFTTPQVFAEIQMQLHERKDADNQTDVISLDAELLDLAIESDNTANVLFSGLLRESKDAEPESMKEIWHFTKNPNNNDDWLVAGIQQQ